jgi:diguanylate cyclase (GGDEF)-like protein/PAS domain S-box-containing protein
VCLALHLGGPRATQLVDDIGELVAPLVAATLCGRTARRAIGARLSWGLLAASCAAQAAGQVVWCYYGVFRGTAMPFPSAGDVGYIAAVPLFVAGLLTVPGVAWRSTSRLRGLLDGAMIAGSMIFVSWALVLGPTFRQHRGSLLSQAISVPYPGSDVLLVSLALIIAVRAGKRQRATLGLLMLGIVGFAVADSSFTYFTALHSYGNGNAFDTGRVAGYLLIAIGAQKARRDAPRQSDEDASDRVSFAAVVTPYGAVGLAGVVTLVRYFEGIPIGVFLSVEGGFLVLALIARQFLTLADNVSLNRRLVVKVERGNEELQAREQRFAALGQHSSDPVIVVSPAGVVLFQSRSVERVLGWSPEATAGHNLREVVHPADYRQWTVLVDQLLPEPKSEATVEWRVRHGDGSWRSLQSVVTNLVYEPSVAGLVLNSRDITAQKALEKKLRYQAFHDPLTGLANRALFAEHLDKAVHRCRRHGGPLEVMLIDLHNFKAINDLHGNVRGDQLLCEVAERLQATQREADVVARVGGDEFAVLLEGPPGWVGPDAAAMRLIESFSTPFGTGTNQVVVQVSVGVAVSGLNGESDKELLRDADLAMNVAREAGAGSYVRFTPALHQRIMDRMRTEIELRQALERGEIVLYYQPVVDLASGEVEGVEALIRWLHPEKGLVPPGMFIDVAESSGLIVTIGEWVLRQACQDLQRWTAAGTARLRMSVNVSPRQLSHPGFEAMVTKVLDDTRADPARVALEITESMLIHDTAGKSDVLARLRALGISIALDDFGTGYSSLSTVREMPIDILKIDKSFIDDIASSAEAACLTQTIIRLADDLGLATIAEGAETIEQVEMLRLLGCKRVQGYYFSRPVPAPELERLLDNGICRPAGAVR